MALPKKPGAAFRKQKRDRERSDLDKQVAIKNWLLLSKSYLFLQPATNLSKMIQIQSSMMTQIQSSMMTQIQSSTVT